MALRLQIRGPGPQARANVGTLQATSTADDLCRAVAQASGVSIGEQRLLIGFPPKEIDLSNGSRSLTDIGIKSGDSIQVEKSSATRGIVKASAADSQNTVYSIPKNQGMFCVRQMPPDNSCLFHSVSYVCCDRKRDAADAMRRKVADAVAADPRTYNATLLEQSNASYQQWIMNPKVWGGAIELDIFARLFQTEIVAFDPSYLREDIYGQNLGFHKRAFVHFTMGTGAQQQGAHYDALVFCPDNTNSESNDKVVFGISDLYAWERARQFVESKHRDLVAKNSSLTLCKSWRRTKTGDVPAPSVGRSMIQESQGSGKSAAARTWSCGACTFANSIENKTCEICGGSK